MKITLDTNICSYILRKQPQEILHRFSQIEQSHIWISSIVASELRFGALKRGSHQLIAGVEALLSGFEIKAWGNNSTHAYAHIRKNLEEKGQIIGNMDLLIAAHALAEDSTLITNNAKEFHRVPNLSLQEWM